jgi:TolB-like protein/DNA-binding winged helix-turn-helix (wHTH) protein/Tfp pilus assembly protein PilF
MDGPSSSKIFLFDEFRLDRRTGALARRDERGAFAPLAVGSRALDVLGVLLQRPGDLVSRAEIISAVWPQTAVEESNLNMQIAALRRVLDEGRPEGSCIRTIPGRGYRFVVPVTPAEFSIPSASDRPSGNGAGGPIRVVSPVPTVVPTRRRRWCEVIALFVVLVVTGSAAAWIWEHRSPGSTDTRPRLSVVVLPFTSLGTDPDQEHLADAITEDLTTDLSLRSEIRVTSPYTAFTHGNKLVDTRQIGRDLGVRYALQGSVERSGNRIRVNTQLIDTDKDTQLWAARFDRAADDLFAVQNEIASQLANSLVWQLVAVEAARMTEHPDALGYILRGRAARLKPNSPEVYAEAIHLFEHALALDPQSYQAQTWLADALAARVLDRMTDSPTADIARAGGLVGQVLAASPRYAPAHFVKGQLLRGQHRRSEAIPEFETVLAIVPNDPETLHALGECKLFTGSIDQVIPLDEQAIRLDPRNPHIGAKYWRIGLVHLLQSRTDEAILWLERAVKDEPEFSFTRAALASAYALNGETGRAGDQLAAARGLAGGKYYSSMATMQAVRAPKIRSLFEATYLAGLHKACRPNDRIHTSECKKKLKKFTKI